MKKGIIFILIFANTFPLYASDILDSCSYKWKVDECIEANKPSWAGPRSIEDFVCISSQSEWKILGQIVLDEEFKKVDEEVEAYLNFLEQSKDYYFWQNAQKTFLEWVDDIDSKFSLTWEFWQKYIKLCSAANEEWILAKISACYENWMSTNAAKDFFIETDCKNLAITKMEIAKQVAYDTLKLNKNQVMKDEQKLYMQDARGKYDKLLEIIMINVSYVERIWKKWPSKTKNPY